MKCLSLIWNLGPDADWNRRICVVFVDWCNYVWKLFYWYRECCSGCKRQFWCHVSVRIAFIHDWTCVNKSLGWSAVMMLLYGGSRLLPQRVWGIPLSYFAWVLHAINNPGLRLPSIGQSRTSGFKLKAGAGAVGIGVVSLLELVFEGFPSWIVLVILGWRSK